MNWRNPFLITYLAVTVVGVGICGYLLYSGYSHYSEVATNYDDAVLKLRKLQNRIPFPSAENNEKYKEFTKQYQAEYDKLVQKVGSMQKSVQDMSPQAFQDLLRASVSQVEAAAKENGVTLPQNFYLGFDQYQGTLPADSAAGPLARELAAIRVVVDDLIMLKSKEILGIKRNLLPQEGSSEASESAPPRNGPGGRSPRNGERGAGGSPVVATPFEIAFVADQSVVRSALNYIVNSDQFFIIRDLNVQNSALEGPKKVEEAQPGAAAAPAADPSAAPAADASAPAQPEHTLRVLVGREKLTVALRIEMITFNNLPSQK
jgi:hypothetical protein